MMSRARTWIWCVTKILLMISALPACAGDHKQHHGDHSELSSDLSKASDDRTRGIHLEQVRLGVDQTLQIRRSRNTVSHELHDGDKVRTGDRIRVTAITSEDAYLYLAFCARHELAIYPSQRGARTRAGEPKLVPEGTGELVIDGEPGTELLYVIVSRTELSLVDPHLAEVLAAANESSPTVDCNVALDAELVKPARRNGSAPLGASAPVTNVIRGNKVAKKPIHASNAHNLAEQNIKVNTSSGSTNGSSHSPPVDPGLRESAAEEPDFIRSPGKMVWYGIDGTNGAAAVVAADDDGIAVVRYRFKHVATTAPP